MGMGHQARVCPDRGHSTGLPGLVMVLAKGPGASWDGQGAEGRPGALLLQVFLLLCCSHCSPSPSAGLLVYFGYGIWHSKENLREPQLQRVSAHYVVFPSGSLEETVQAVQPSPQPAAGLPDTDTDEAKR